MEKGRSLLYIVRRTLYICIASFYYPSYIRRPNTVGSGAILTSRLSRDLHWFSIIAIQVQAASGGGNKTRWKQGKVWALNARNISSGKARWRNGSPATLDPFCATALCHFVDTKVLILEFVAHRKNRQNASKSTWQVTCPTTLISPSTTVQPTSQSPPGRIKVGCLGHILSWFNQLWIRQLSRCQGKELAVQQKQMLLQEKNLSVPYPSSMTVHLLWMITENLSEPSSRAPFKASSLRGFFRHLRSLYKGSQEI